MPSDLLWLIGGAFGLTLTGSVMLAVVYVLLCFVGGLDDGTKMMVFLLLLVASIFNKLFGVAKGS